MNDDENRDLQLARILENELNAPLANGHIASSDDPERQLSDEEKQRLAKARTALAAIGEIANPNPSDSARDTKTQHETRLDHCDFDLDDSVDRGLPEKLGKFEIVRELGRGGFAVVFLARDPALDRLVALKLLKPNVMDSNETCERFEREAKLSASLSHPSIVPVFETGRIGPMIYIASAYCPGGTMRQWFNDHDRNVSPTTAARLIARMADAVQHAHNRGVIHRDIKPANVFFDTNENEPSSTTCLVEALRISDFGLAKSTLDSSDLSRSEALIGTPAYMSPEQASGDTHNIGPSSDVYALGVCLYELLTGKLPHRKDTYIKTLHSIEQDPPASPRSINRNIPVDLEAICLKCLEKRTDDRYASAFELEQDLQRFLNGHPVRARRTGPLTKVARWAQRNPALAVAMSIAFVSLAIGFAVSTWQWSRAERNIILANQQTQRADRHLERIETTVDRLVYEFVGFLEDIPRSEPLRKQVLAEALTIQREILQEESDDPLVIARNAQAHRRMGNFFLLAGELDDALRAYLDAEDLFHKLPDQTLGKRKYIELGMVYLEQGYIADKQNRPDDALELTQLAVDSFTHRSLEGDSLALAELANAWRQTGISLVNQNKIEPAGEAFAKAVDCFQHQQIDWDQLSPQYWIRLKIGYAKALNSLGIHQKSNGQYQQARQLYIQSIDIIDSVIERYPYRLRLSQLKAKTAVNLANLIYWQQDYQAAEKWYSIAAEEFESLVNDFPATYSNHEHLLLALTGKGLAARKIGQHEAAKEHYLHAIEMSESTIDKFGATTSLQYNMAITYSNLANLLREDMDLSDQALDALHSALAIKQSLVDKYPDSLLYRLSHAKTAGLLAMLLYNQGDVDKAIPMSQSALLDSVELYKLNPNAPQHLSNVVWQLTRNLKILAGSGDHRGAWKNSDQVSQLDNENSELQLEVAKALANCLVWLQQTDATHQLDEADRSRYLDNIASILVTAHSTQAFDIEKLLNSDAFKSIRDSAEFRKVVSLDQSP